MAEITAAAVMSLRDKTGLPMMECKKALTEAKGDVQAAIEALRIAGKKTGSIRSDRETSSGRIAVHTEWQAGVGAMIELQCESAPVANSPEFAQFAKDIAKQLATGPGAKTPEELLAQPAPGKSGQTLADVKDDMFNRIREVFKLSRVVRIDGTCGGYAHHDGSAGALVQVSGGNADVAKDIAMHIVAKNPKVAVKEQLDPAAVDKEREILLEGARKEGKPENIIVKMVEGRLKNFYAEHVLAEQPFIKEESETVGKYAAGAKMKIESFVSWKLGKT